VTSLNEPDPTSSTSRIGETGGLPRHELVRRASAGIVIVFTRGVAIALLSLGGSVVLARLLDPHAFGVVAIGMTVVAFASVLADGGLGAGLIRRADPPSVEELQALTGFQLAVTVALSLVAAALAAPFGEIGWVTALMVSSTPLAMLQLSGRILLERSLSYRPLAAVELSQVLAYNVWAISLVVLGFGVWGLASGTVAMRVVAVVVMARVSPAGLVWPRLSWSLTRPLLGFGIRFQANTAAWLAGDQGLNVSLAAIAGVSTLGLWSLANRLLQVSSLLVQALTRVSFPAVSQLVAANEDVAPLIERAVGMVAVGSGIIFTGLAGASAGLIPGVFGEQWRGASVIMPGACLGAAIGTSVGVSAYGYLFAVGDVSAVLRSTIVQTIALLAVTLTLVPVLGVSAIGLGWFVMAVVQVFMLRRAVLQWMEVDLVRPLLAPVAAGVVSAGAGWLIAGLDGADLVSGLVGGACSVFLFLTLIAVLDRKLLRETIRFARGGIRAATSRGPPAAGSGVS
jgi:O-antigen/teichoic acid export membrane protein